jgi:hypothetical protein
VESMNSVYYVENVDQPFMTNTVIETQLIPSQYHPAADKQKSATDNP